MFYSSISNRCLTRLEKNASLSEVGGRFAATNHSIDLLLKALRAVALLAIFYVFLPGQTFQVQRYQTYSGEWVMELADRRVIGQTSWTDMRPKSLQASARTN
jgi:hypothetical protein